MPPSASEAGSRLITLLASFMLVLQLLLAGADCVMLASSLLQKGPGHNSTLLEGMKTWMDEREYSSVQQMKGSLSQLSCPNPAAFERSNYMKALRSYSSPFA